MSDFSLLGTALQPGGRNYVTKFMTSLDHTIWFHNPFRVDEWMLYEAFSPQAGKKYDVKKVVRSTSAIL